MQVWTDPNGRIEFHHAPKGLNEKVPQDYIDATRPVMQQIEARLVAQFGMLDLTGSNREHCNAARCEPIVAASSR